jgi:hypothetical protein
VVGRHNVPVIRTIRSWLRAQHSKNEQWRRDVEAMHLDGVRRLSDLSDEELIAADPTIPGTRHQMEMQRRLKVAIQALTAETVTARKSANRGALIIVALTAALVALTVVLAFRN